MLIPGNKKDETNQINALSLEECFAKTVCTREGIKEPGLGVFAHCYIVGLVAIELINREPEWLQICLLKQECITLG